MSGNQCKNFPVKPVCGFHKKHCRNFIKIKYYLGNRLIEENKRESKTNQLHIQNLKQRVPEAGENRSSERQMLSYVAFLDIQKAYDTVTIMKRAGKTSRQLP
jgi:hypothetical protein